MKRIISREFKRMPQGELTGFATTVTTLMTSNPLFVNLRPDVDALKVLITEYSTALANAANGGKQLTAIKDTAYKTVTNKLDLIAFEVEKIVDGDKLMAEEAGFRTYKDPTHRTELDTPWGLKAVNLSRSGEFKLSWQTVEGAVNYAVEYQIQGESTWRNGTYSTKKDVVMVGFTKGSSLNLIVRALGHNNLKSEFSEPVSILVL